jgi:LmbE family N-acetylglucosaminyl deacetylase
MSQKFPPLAPKVVLGIAAHPDDLDFGAAGSMAQFAQEGAAVYYLILTDGASGSEDREIEPARLRDIRRDEQRSAGKILGLRDVYFCEYPDGTLSCDAGVKRDIIRVIRRLRPDTVVCWDPTLIYSVKRGILNHPDHRAAGQAALDAVFPLARDHMSFPELYRDEGLEPHKVAHLLMMNFDNNNFAVNITGTIDTKFRALAEHASQFKDFAAKRDQFTKLAATIGEPYGYSYAEGFVRLEISDL